MRIIGVKGVTRSMDGRLREQVRKYEHNNNVVMVRKKFKSRDISLNKFCHIRIKITLLIKFK